MSKHFGTAVRNFHQNDDVAQQKHLTWTLYLLHAVNVTKHFQQTISVKKNHKLSQNGVSAKAGLTFTTSVSTVLINIWI